MVKHQVESPEAPETSVVPVKRRKTQIAMTGEIDEDVVGKTNEQPFADFLSQHACSGSLKFTPRPTTKRDGDKNDLCTTSFDLSIHDSPKSKRPSGADLSGDDDRRLNKEDFNACFNLVEETSGDAYRESSRGWNPTAKRKEMRDPDMRYLIARSQTPSTSSNRNVAGFLSFMVTYEDGLPVVYIYEIHLLEATRGCGLGAHMLRTVESIGSSIGLMKTMLTVFRSNEHAWKWYESRGYGIDEYSPANKRLRGGKVKKADYLILSKRLEPSQ